MLTILCLGLVGVGYLGFQVCGLLSTLAMASLFGSSYILLFQIAQTEKHSWNHNGQEEKVIWGHGDQQNANENTLFYLA